MPRKEEAKEGTTLITTAIILVLFGPYRQCNVAVGTIQNCSATSYNGVAIIMREGHYKQCKVGNGRVVQCQGRFSGDAVAYHDAKWRRCRISTGKVFSCDGTGYRGSVVTQQRR